MNQIFALSLLVFLSFRAPLALAGPSAHFSKGAETFKIENKKGQTPTFRVLSDTMTKQALAVASISLINAQEEVKPKIPLTNYIDVKFQTLTLEPVGKKDLQLHLKLSGYNVDFDQAIDKKDFLDGKVIEIQYPKTEREIAMYSVESRGKLKLHLERDTQVLILENVEAKMTFESPLGDDGSEFIQFSGKAIRAL